MYHCPRWPVCAAGRTSHTSLQSLQTSWPLNVERSRVSEPQTSQIPWLEYSASAVSPGSPSPSGTASAENVAPTAPQDLRALVLTRPRGETKLQVAMLRQRFGKTSVVTGNRALQRELALTADDRSRTVLFLDLEAMGGIGAAFETLRGIRTLYPEMVTVLVTTGAGGQTFDLTRLPICDVTLDAAFDGRDVELALFAGARNNGVWRERVAELAKMAA